MSYSDFVAELEKLERKLAKEVEKETNGDDSDFSGFEEELAALITAYYGAQAAKQFLKGYNRIGKQAGESAVKAIGGVSPKARRFLQSTIDTAESVAKIRASGVVSQKRNQAALGKLIDTEFREALENAAQLAEDGYLVGQARREGVKQIEEVFENQAKALKKNSKKLFEFDRASYSYYSTRLKKTIKVGESKVSMSAKNYAQLVRQGVENENAIKGEIAQLEELGDDIAQIPTNAGTEDGCVDYEGSLVSVSGTNSGKSVTWQGSTYTVLDYNELRTDAHHIYHPNCKHFYFDYIDNSEIEVN